MGHVQSAFGISPLSRHTEQSFDIRCTDPLQPPTTDPPPSKVAIAVAASSTLSQSHSSAFFRGGMRREGIARVLGLGVGDVDVQTIPADGDCLFASLSSALAQHKPGGVGHSIRELRSMVAQEVGEEQARRQSFSAIIRPPFRCLNHAGSCPPHPRNASRC
jgi:hypothetical protein